jgi:hypothetical protein
MIGVSVSETAFVVLVAEARGLAKAAGASSYCRRWAASVRFAP